MWTEGTSNGGTPVIDYFVWAATDGVNFEERQINVVSTQVTLTDFNLGVTYTFKVKARNAFGFSDFSLPIVILAA